MTKEAVNHPAHYGGDVTHEVYKCLEAWDLVANAYLWNAVKYLARAGKKNDYLEDLRKAKWYLEREIERAALAIPAFLSLGKIKALKIRAPKDYDTEPIAIGMSNARKRRKRASR